jgi:CheY-like chemotaxis protein
VAAEKIRTNFYDLILLDLHLSDIDGYELIEKVSDQKLPPIICISGDSLDLNELKEKGYSDYIKKPIDRSILEQKVSHYTGISFSTTGGNNETESDKYKLIDLSYLIDSSLNDQKYIVNMINIFLEKAPGYLSDMQSAYADNDLVELKRIAHKFKASLNIMGIKSATKLINVLEVNIQKDQNLGDLNKLLTGIELYTISACKELETYLAK